MLGGATLVPFDKTALHMAVEQGDIEAVKLLLATGEGVQGGQAWGRWAGWDWGPGWDWERRGGGPRGHGGTGDQGGIGGQGVVESGVAVKQGSRETSEQGAAGHRSGWTADGVWGQGPEGVWSGRRKQLGRRCWGRRCAVAPRGLGSGPCHVRRGGAQRRGEMVVRERTCGVQTASGHRRVRRGCRKARRVPCMAGAPACGRGAAGATGGAEGGGQATAGVGGRGFAGNARGRTVVLLLKDVGIGRSSRTWATLGCGSARDRWGHYSC